MVKIILCILAVVVVVYLAVAFYKSRDTEFIPIEDMDDKDSNYGTTHHS